MWGGSCGARSSSAFVICMCNIYPNKSEIIGNSVASRIHASVCICYGNSIGPRDEIGSVLRNVSAIP